MQCAGSRCMRILGITHVTIVIHFRWKQNFHIVLWMINNTYLLVDWIIFCQTQSLEFQPFSMLWIQQNMNALLSTVSPRNNAYTQQICKYLCIAIGLVINHLKAIKNHEQELLFWNSSKACRILQPTRTNSCFYHLDFALSDCFIIAQSARGLTVRQARWEGRAWWRLHKVEEGQWTGRGQSSGSGHRSLAHERPSSQVEKGSLVNLWLGSEVRWTDSKRHQHKLVGTVWLHKGGSLNKNKCEYRNDHNVMCIISANT